MLPKNITRLSNVRYRKDNQGIKPVAAIFIASYDYRGVVRIRIQGQEHLVRPEDVWPEREWEKHVLLDEYGDIFEKWAKGEYNCTALARGVLADKIIAAEKENKDLGYTIKNKARSLKRVIEKAIELQIIAPKPTKE